MELTKKEIEKVFAMYLGCELETNLSDGFMQNYGPISMDKEVASKTIGTIAEFYRQKIQDEKDGFTDTEHLFCKVLLTPLSKISDEDAMEVAKIWDVSVVTDITIEHVKYYFKEYGTVQNIEIFQYLISQGYAVPLFFAPNHPANGKTAIELGLAIEKQ